jgi:hypothetical protein
MPAMITTRTSLERAATIAHPRHNDFGITNPRSTAGLAELRVKF